MFIICLLLISLSARVADATCDDILMSGVVGGYVMNGNYKLQQGVVYQNQPVWKNTKSNYLLYYWYYWWEWGTPLGGYSEWLAYAYGPSPLALTSAINLLIAGSTMDTIVDCADSGADEYHTEGLCDQFIIATHTDVNFDNCLTMCNSEITCMGLSFSYEGCVLHYQSCLNVLTEPEYGGWYYHIGPISDFLYGKDAHQSSTDARYDGAANKAIDGVIYPKALEEPQGCAITEDQAGAWWAVDLGGMVKLNKVIIKIRGDCCEDQLTNFNIAGRGTGPLSSDLAILQTNGPTTMDLNVCYRSASPVRLNQRLNVDCDIFATYLVVYRTDITVSAPLVLCEVEVAVDEDAIAGRYLLVRNRKVLKDESDSVCSSYFGGYPVDVSDAYELSLVESYLNSLSNTPDRMLINKMKDDVKFLHEIDEKWQFLSDVKNGAYCTTSPPSDDCTTALTDNGNTVRITLAVGGFFKITLSAKYTVHMVVVKMFFDTWTEITLSLDNVEIDTVTTPYDASGMAQWLRMNVAGGIAATEVKITFTNAEADVNIVGVRVYGSVAGWHAREGGCSDTGNTLDGTELLGMDDVDACLVECLLTENCVGVEITQVEALLDCYFRSAACAEANYDASLTDVSLWELSDTADIVISSRLAGCINTGPANLYFPETVVSCMQKCAERENCVAFTWATSNGCILVTDSENCNEQYMSQMYENAVPNLFTILKATGVRRADYVGCYKSGAESKKTYDPSQPAPDGSLPTCRAYCASNNKKFAISEQYTACYCSDEVGILGEAKSCNGKCLFAEQDTCGYIDLTMDAAYMASGDFDPTCYVLDHHVALGYGMRLAECSERNYVLCERDLSFCYSNPCKNGATCVELTDYKIECECAQGFEGYFCDIDINECLSDPCVHGSCTDLPGPYKCTCQPGYEGVNCAVEKNECASDPCQHGGTCVDAVNKYTCNCPAGTFGTNCETDINECASNPCRNGGSCNNNIGSYSCNCSPGYIGTQCATNVNECGSSPCQHGGACEDKVNGYTCTCPLGFAGDDCEIELQECASYPCKNGATCHDLANKYECTCVPGFQGITCQNEINECASDPCANGAECVDLINSFDCECVAGFAGEICDEFIGNPGVWTTWGEWTSCSATCGDAIHYRERECKPLFDNPGVTVGNCDGSDTESGSCNLELCPPVDGNWGGWRPYSPCSVTCGTGIQNATRFCDYPPPSNGGKDCDGETSQFRIQLCRQPNCKAFESYTEWSEWSECSGVCGNSVSTRERMWIPYGYENNDNITTSSNTSSASSSSQSAGSAGRQVPEVIERHCVMDECAGLEALSCSVCTGSYSSNVASLPNCDISQSCEGSETFCSVAYNVDANNALTLEKSCTTKSVCDAVTEPSTTCLSIGGLARLGDSRMGGVSHSIDYPEELLTLWSTLNGTCELCCSGNGCNNAVLPSFVYLPDNRVHSSATDCRVGLQAFIIILFSIAIMYI